jgi:hypothetical protein
MNDPRTYTPCWRKFAESLYQRLARLIETLVDILQPFGCDRLDAHERAFDVRASHRIEERIILCRLHRYLGEEHHVRRQFRQPCHELEPFGPQRPELLEARHVALPLRHREISQGDRVEIVVGECDEAEAAAAKLDDLRRHGVHGSLSRFLSVRTPDRAE